MNQNIFNYGSDLTVQGIFDAIGNSGSGLSSEGDALSSLCSTKQQDLQNQEQCLLSAGVPTTITPSMEQAYISDWQLRQQANTVLLQAVQCQEAYLQSLQTDLQIANQHWVRPFLVQVAGTGFDVAINGLAFVQPEFAPVAFAYDTGQFALNEFQNEQTINQYEPEYLSTFTSMQTCMAFAGLVYNNVNSAYAQIRIAQPPNPATGSKLSPQPQATEEGYYPVTTGIYYNYVTGSPTPQPVYYFVITKVYSTVTIQNNSSSSATNMVFSFYSYNTNPNGQNNILETCGFDQVNNLAPGQSTTVTINHALDENNGPSATPLSQVQIVLLGVNGTGTFWEDSQTVTPTILVDSTPEITSRLGSNGTKYPSGGAQSNDGGSSNIVVVIDNPITSKVIQNPTNQTYQAQLGILNLFVVPFTVTVTQPLPPGATVLTTDGTLHGSSIVWTNTLAPSNAVENSFTFSLSVIPGAQTNLPPATVVFTDTNGNNLTFQGPAPNFDGLFPVVVSSSIPAAVPGVDSTMSVTVTNVTASSQSGSLTVVLTDSSGNTVTNVLESFVLDGSDSTNLSFILPGSLPPGSYSLTGSLSINGGSGQVLAGTYVVPEPPVALSLGSTPALTTNGLDLALQGPAGEYLIEASSDLSSSANWQPILFYSNTNASFYYNFTAPVATNANQQFYRAVRFSGVQPNLGLLSVLTNGNGLVSPNYNGALLQIGLTYSMTATAGSGFVFTNWTGGTNLPLTVLTSGPTLTFVMQTNLILQANFVSTNQTPTTNLVIGPSKLLSNGQFQLTVNGGVLGQNYVLLASTNLVDWSPISGFVDTNPPVTIYDPNASKYPWRFYRIGPESTAPAMQLGLNYAQPLNSNGFNVILYSLPGLNYEIQASTNLVDWTTITNFVSTNSPFYLSIPTTTNAKQEFYRAVLP